MLGVSATQSRTNVHHARPPLDKELDTSIFSYDLFKKPEVQDVIQTKGGICYLMDNGDKFERVGGSIAWRNNNPGCIRYSKKIANMGAIGKAYGFAIFPDEETGMNAIKSLLLSDSYCDLSIAQAINKYAPPHENNTTHYISSLCGVVGVSKHTKLHDLNDEQLICVVKTIRKIEGWIEGAEVRVISPKPEYKMKVIRAANDHTQFVLNRLASERVL